MAEHPREKERAMSVSVPSFDSFRVEGEILPRRMTVTEKRDFQEALLSLGAAMSVAEFREAACAGLQATLFNVVKANAILIDHTSEVLSYFTGEGEVKPLPSTEHLWKVVRHGGQLTQEHIPSSDPLCEVLGITEKKMGEGVVLLERVPTETDKPVIAIVMAVCDWPTAALIQDFEWLLKNTLVAALRVQKHISTERHQMRTQGMLEMSGNLIDLDTTMLSLKIAKYMKSELFCKQCLLFIVDNITGELCCQVFDNAPLEKEIRLNVTDCIYGRCVLSEETVLVDNAAEDVRINPSTDFINNYKPKSVMCLPIYNGNGDTKKVIGVAAAFDKISSKSFGIKDSETMKFILRFSSFMLSSTLAFQHEMSLKNQNQALLQVAKTLFTSLDQSQVLLRTVMTEAKNLIKAERCSLFLVDKDAEELVAVVFDGSIPGHSPGTEKTLKIRFGRGIVGHVAKTGETLNIKDAYNHPKFYPEVDKTTGFKTRNVLCIPISTDKGIVGVAELMNKIGGRYFTSYDEELAKAFSVYCGISIYHSMLYSDIVKEQFRSRLAADLMIYHMKISADEVKQIACEAISPPESFHPSIREYSFSPRVIQEHDSLRLVISMMQGMNLLNKWKISRETLASFVLMVKTGYRDTPYHNWWHALSVTHFFFVLDQRCQLLPMLSDMEQLALFISCLCHDIDHRGTNNAYQTYSNSILASVYSSEGSVMERHHAAQTLCLLNSDRCNILNSLGSSEYKEIIALVQSNILATDLANHLKALNQMEAMSQTGYDRGNKTHHELLSSLIMTSCDLCNACKDWEMTQKISELIYKEFFTQGDLEKALGVTPVPMMDRDKAFVPKQQIGFLSNIALPVYKILSEILGDTEAVYQSVLENKARWSELAESAQ